MKKLMFIVMLTAIATLFSCEKCKECYMSETSSNTNQVVESSLGKYCGKELEDIDGSSYAAIDGNVTVNCE